MKHVIRMVLVLGMFFIPKAQGKPATYEELAQILKQELRTNRFSNLSDKQFEEF